MSAWLALACFIALGGDGATDAPPADHLALRVAAPASVIAAISARLTPRLAALGVGLEVASVPAVDVERVLALPPDNRPGAPLARAWLDGQDIDGAMLILVPRSADRVLVRRVPLVLGVDEVGLAEITYIIERAVASLLASEPIGVPQAQARAAVNAGATDRARRPDSRSAAEGTTMFRVGLFGGVGGWSSTEPAVAEAGLDAWLDRVTGRDRFGLAASAVVAPGFHVSDSNGDFAVRTIAAHLYATLGRRLGRLGIGRVGAGPALLVTHVAPSFTVASPTDSATPAPRTDLDPAISAAARWEMPFAPWASVFLTAMVDIVPRTAHYSEIVDGTERTLFSPWWLRPGLVLGLNLGSAER